MSNFQVDLSNCDQEPIHIPGQIQSHGYLIVIDQDYKILYLSDNIAGLFPEITKVILGSPLQYIETHLGNSFPAGFITNLINSGRINKNIEQSNPFSISISGIPYYLIISASADNFLLEFEPAVTAAEADIQKMVGNSLSRMLTDKNLDDLLKNTAVQVKKTINYDRVMIYRFAQDGHGEVVAEDKNEELDSWMGLHYPASDIPKQARALYKLNLTRLIADVHSISTKISTSAENDQPLDLTNSQLRAVSPIHIQYLKNMGVVSSFSISLICKNELWGLVSCHNYMPRFIDYKARESSKLIGQILSSALEFRQDESNQQVNEVYKNNVDKLAKSLQNNNSIEDALTKEPITLLDVVQASGAVLVFEKNIVQLGTTPGDQQLSHLIEWIKQHPQESLYFTDNLSAVYPEAAAYKYIASGLMLCVLSSEMDEYIIWFKPEQIHTIKWAGNPEKQIDIDEKGFKHISPRHSFDVWSQTVSGTSVHWKTEEVNSVTRLKEEITYAINLKAGAMRLLNEKLRQAYEELDTFSYTISHDLKSPITAIKGYAQLLTKSKTSGDGDHRLSERIADRADKMNLMISTVLEYSRIGRLEPEMKTINAGNLISEIIKDLDMAYDSKKLKIILGDTPQLKGDLQMMQQVFSNLIGNAIKYSLYADPAVVHIEGIVNQTEICYCIKDNGIGIAIKDIPLIFGLFKRMDNVQDIEGTGVGLAIVKRIVEKLKGKIWVESELGKGSSFFVSFKK
jgi:chemotaxis family two-component system sensor kinase Cph1